jgi:hypothetical protein
MDSYFSLYTLHRFCTLVLIQLISTKRFGKCTLRSFFQDWQKETIVVMDPVLFVTQTACRYGCYTCQTHHPNSLLRVHIFLPFFPQRQIFLSPTQQVYCWFLSLCCSFHWLKKYVSDKVKIVYAHTRFFCCHNFARCHCCSTELMSIGDYSLFLALPCRPSLEESIMGSL